MLSSILLYGACGLGAVGVALSLPKKTFSPFIIGGLISAVALGVLLLGLGLATPSGELPGVLFYVFSLIALGSALRVISHPRPVYAALYFVLTIISSSGLYLLLSAEFMAFALIIVYAGAILITYLFVIMLATESPSADEIDALADYDRYSREPIGATIAGFVLLAALTTILGGGASKLRYDPSLAAPGDALLASSRDGAVPTGMRKKVETALRQSFGKDGKPLLAEGEGLVFSKANGGWAVVSNPRGISYLEVADAHGTGTKVRRIAADEWPTELSVSNVEGVAFELIDNHPGAIEIAGIILLMAMLGAVVLARKKVDMDEAERHAQVNVLGYTPAGGAT